MKVLNALCFIEEPNF